MLCRPCHKAITKSVRARRGAYVSNRNWLVPSQLMWVIGLTVAILIAWFGRHDLPPALLVGFWFGLALALWMGLARRHPLVAVFVMAFVAGLIGGGRRRW